MARPKSDAETLLKLFVHAGNLKKERRRGWVKKLGVADAESVADHSYRTALMAMVISDARGLDSGRAAKLALLHDLPEALVGDAMPGEKPEGQKLAAETMAMRELVKGLPDGLADLYEEAWDEFVEGRSEEAVLVRQLDKLEMAVQAWEYAKGSAERAVAREFLETARRHVKDEELRRLLALVEL